MAKPRLIIIIRHGQSEGNKNRDIHQTIPDHRVKLTQDGWQQAKEAGRRLRGMLRADDTLHFFTSPYRRTRETTEGILSTLTADDPDPSPFKRNNIKVYEEPRLREQDFGNFQPCSAEMERMWQERADYGHFFYRIPNGESAADAYDRVSGFNESLWRQFNEDDFASVCVLVTHGLMSRVFLMKWYHFSVEYFEDLRNVNHCEFLIMRKEEESLKYVLVNKLRTWSELRRERERKQQKEGEGKDVANGAANGNGTAMDVAVQKDQSKLEKAASSPVVPQRRWGGCPNGCNHDKNFKIRSGFLDLVRRDGTASHLNNSGSNDSSKTASPTTHGPPSSGLLARRPAARRFQSSETAISDGGDEDDGDATPLAAPQIDIARAQQEIVSSPDATPSFITPDARLRSPNGLLPGYLHVGRDFGGTYSGHTSDADSSEDERTRRRGMRSPNGHHGLHLSSLLHHGHGHGLMGLIHSHGNTNGNNSNNTNGQNGGAADITTTTIITAAGGSSNGGHTKSRSAHRLANRLGDVSHCSDCEHEGDDQEESDGPATPESGADGVAEAREEEEEQQQEDEEDLVRAEREDRSIAGSVY